MAKKTKQPKTKKQMQQNQKEDLSKDAAVEEQLLQQDNDKVLDHEEQDGHYDGHNDNDDEDEDDELSSEEEGEDLILEGVLVRNPDVESSDDDSSDDERTSEDEAEPLPKKIKGNNHRDNHDEQRSKSNQQKNKKKNPCRKKDKEMEIIPVEFTFHDMNEQYFHGIKNFLLSHPIYASHSSALADLIIDNISVGTVVSTDDGQDNVYGFASVLNVSSYCSNPSIQAFKRLCLNACPEQHKHEMETVLSGKTKRPAGIFMHGRMVNLPLEITHVLHEQLVQDMEWAVKHADGGEEQRKSLNFGAFVLLAPCVRDSSSSSSSSSSSESGNANGIVYKNFDDEIFAQCAEFVYPLNASPSDWPKKSHNREDEDKHDKQDMAKKKKKKQEQAGQAMGVSSSSSQSCKDFVHAIVLTRTGHEKAMKQLHQLIHGS